MQLTSILLKLRGGVAPGRIWGGKHRKFRPITEGMRNRAVKRLLDEIENMKILTLAPHISEDEEQVILRNKRRESIVEAKHTQKRKMPEHKRLEDHLAGFSANRAWE
ncbi:PREDICTED: ribosomal protein 63, mitochondrial-like [Priapulus caudatus]|uniref:Ribosomal protein 63, mitochondrial-like n=1 Tax=Priapulus caudatus TaxID=37621 RepID=A0ABM1EW37_PRICU|nr:PREDICTED: ribosomal protein 63, mitochondrial-like [Priapulus caudatus]